MEGSVAAWAIGIVAATVFVLALVAFAYWCCHSPHTPRTDDNDDPRDDGSSEDYEGGRTGLLRRLHYRAVHGIDPVASPDHASLLGRVGRRVVNWFGGSVSGDDQEDPSGAAYRQIPSASSPDHREDAASTSTGSGHDDGN